jgi:hypothetical protein
MLHLYRARPGEGRPIRAQVGHPMPPSRPSLAPGSCALTARCRFGILPGCDHAFCIRCLREWRAKYEQGQAIRSCPVCRTVSYFLVPSGSVPRSGGGGGGPSTGAPAGTDPTLASAFARQGLGDQPVRQGPHHQ